NIKSTFTGPVPTILQCMHIPTVRMIIAPHYITSSHHNLPSPILPQRLPPATVHRPLTRRNAAPTTRLLLPRKPLLPVILGQIGWQKADISSCLPRAVATDNSNSNLFFKILNHCWRQCFPITNKLLQRAKFGIFLLFVFTIHILKQFRGCAYNMSSFLSDIGCKGMQVVMLS